MTCTCGHSGELHDFETQVCKSHNCYCMKFNEAINFNSVITAIQKYLTNITEVSDSVKILLDNVKFLRNEDNKDFVLWYWLLVDGSKDKNVLHIVKELMKHKNKLADSETIRRVKQKLAETMPERYGALDPKLLQEKETKQLAIMEFITH